MRPLLCKLLFLGVLCVVLMSCNTKARVSDAIRNQLHSGAERIDVKAVATTFSWGKMYVFAPYTPKDVMCKKVGYSPGQCSKSKLRDADEGEFLLVFMQGGEMTHVESFARTIGNFDESERCSGVPISADKSHFKVEQKNGFFLVCE